MTSKKTATQWVVDVFDNSVLEILWSQNEAEALPWELRMFQESEVIHSCGRPVDGLYVLLDGEIDIYKGSGSTNQKLLSNLTPNRSMALTHVLEKTNSDYTYVAARESLTLFLPQRWVDETLALNLRAKKYLLNMARSSHHRFLLDELRSLGLSREFQLHFIGEMEVKFASAQQTLTTRHGWFGQLLFGEANWSRADQSIAPVPVGEWLIGEEEESEIHSYSPCVFLSLDSLNPFVNQYPDEWDRWFHYCQSGESEVLGKDQEVSDLSELFKDLELIVDPKKKYPIALQSEEMDCGAAVLAMISDYYGKKISLGFLKSKLNPSNSGLSLEDLEKVSRQLGFRTFAIEFQTMDDIDKEHFPIVLLREGHFVVVYDPKEGWIGDPAIGLHKSPDWLNSNSEDRIFGLLLKPTAGFYDRDFPTDTLKKYQNLFSIHKNRFLKITSFSLAIAAFTIVTTLLLQEYVTVETKSFSFGLALAVVAISIFSGILDYFRAIGTMDLSQSMGSRLEKSFVSKIWKIDHSRLSQKRIGDFTQRLSEISAIQDIIADEAIRAVVSTLVSIALLAFLTIISPIMIIPTLITAGLLTSNALFVQGKLRPLFSRWLLSATEKESTIIDLIKCALSFKSRNQQELAQSIANLNIDRSQEHRKDFNRWLALNRVFSTSITFVAQFTYLILVAHLIQSDRISLGTGLASILLFEILLSPLTELAYSWPTFLEARTMLFRIGEILSLKEEESNPNLESHHPLDEIQSIELRNVYFKFRESDDGWILKNANLKISKNDRILLSGTNGQGKSTLFLLVLGHLKPNRGDILINGKSIQDGFVHSVRSRVSLASQNPDIFPGTISENITFGLEFDGTRLENALQDSGFDLVVKKRNLEYESKIRPDTMGFSRGELQKLQMARELYRNTTVLLVDEATASMDRESEKKIINALRDRELEVVVWISHHSNASTFFNRHIELKNGVFVEEDSTKRKRSA
ncbi:MAG: ATP-binding cassette domain-containing protein [Bdellovibrionales bacterium]|nr:ATP-binding cassette domain-containing protein [Bdellovibrionales bacterium]